MWLCLQKGSVLAALDATKEPEIGSKYGVKGYPTLKYFVNGEFKYDVSARDEAKIVEFMKVTEAGYQMCSIISQFLNIKALLL